MQLDSFIKTTLLEIASGVKQANEEIKPALNGDYKLFLLPPGSNPDKGTCIAFDIAITTKKEKAGSSGVNAKIAVVGANIGGKAGSTQQDVSRIQFTVEINQYHG